MLALNSADGVEQLTDEEPLDIKCFVAIDGGQTLKRSAVAGIADNRQFHSDYLIPDAEVDQFQYEVKRRVRATTANQARNHSCRQLSDILSSRHCQPTSGSN